MSYEAALVWIAVITMATLLIEIWSTYILKGFAFGFSSNRDPRTEYSPLKVRIQRTYLNQVESTAYIVPVLIAAALVDLEVAGGELAALLIVLGRAAFAPLYYSGIPFIRVIAFGAAMLSAVYLAYHLLVTAL